MPPPFEYPDARLQDEARRRLAAIVESSNAAIIAKTLDGISTDWNPAAERLYGYTAAEVIGRPISLLIPPDRPDELPAILARLARGERVEHFETQRLRKDGRRLEVSVTISPILDQHGAAIGASVIARDVTERRRTQEALALSEERFRRQFDAVPLAAYIWRRAEDDFVLEQHNAAAEFATEGHVVDAVGVRASEFFRDTLQVLDDLRLCRVDARAIRREMLYRLRTTSAERHLIVHYVPVPPDSVMVLTEDVTERVESERERTRLLARERAARAEIEAAAHAREDLLMSLSHDLSSPITAILGFVQMQKRRAARSGSEELATFVSGLDHLAEAAGRMQTMLAELLDASRLDGDRPLHLVPVATDLVALAGVVTKRWQAATERHQLRLEAETTSLSGRWDASRLERVLDNLVSNAVKFSPAGGQIVLRVSREIDADGGAEWALVQVHDEGLGIPPSDLPHVFERFHRGRNVEWRIAGSGIGLAGAAQIIEQHGGTISVESREGAGSRFRILLPSAGAGSAGMAGDETPVGRAA